MSRQMDKRAEDRELRRRIKLVKALEFELAEAVQNLGAELQGFAIRYEEMSCLLTLKADFEGRRHVSFIYSDSMMNCIISATNAAERNRLNWQTDKYHRDEA